MLTFPEINLTFTNERSEKKFPEIEKVWAYLAARGIDRETADKCGLHVMKAIELIAAARHAPNINGVDNRAAVVFPHWRIGTNDPIEWWSARLVNTGDAPILRAVTSFADLVDPAQRVGGAMGKMFCPPNEPIHAYLLPKALYEWDQLREGERVYLHESAIKSINGGILGYPSIGLNGVWGWGSKKHGIALVEEIRDIPWKAKNLTPVIVFDSNVRDSWQVQQAEVGLAAKLLEITGQHALALRLPKKADGEDQGFDDFRVSVGDTAAREFLEGEGELVEMSERQQMFLQLSSEVCVVRELGRIADQVTGDLMSRQTFTDVNYAHFNYAEEDGERVRVVNVPKVWLASPNRVEAQSLEYAPGKGRMIRTETGMSNLNLWRGMGLEPESGNVDPWLELITNNIPDDDLRQWFIAWCAYPLQNPGSKMNSFPLVFGPSGMGKNLIFKPFHTIYGRNAVMINTKALKSNFTSLYAMRQFVHADELVRARGEEDAVSQVVKALVTSEKLTVNKKGQPEYDIDNHVNLAVTSNYWDCLRLDADDRRSCVIRWNGAIDRRGDQSYWRNYVEWCERGGANALYDYLLNKTISWFDPAAWAPATSWKEQVKEASMGPMESHFHDMFKEPTNILPIVSADKALWTAKELASMYYGKGFNELSPGEIKAVANSLRNTGFVQAHEGNLIKRDGIAERFWVIQQRDKEWNAAACSAHFKLHK